MVPSRKRVQTPMYISMFAPHLVTSHWLKQVTMPSPDSRGGEIGNPVDGVSGDGVIRSQYKGGNIQEWEELLNIFCKHCHKTNRKKTGMAILGK
jgi:hypothetical protein